MDAKEIKRRFEALESERSNIESTWEIITKFIAPYRGEFFESNTTEHSVDWKLREIFDSTAIDASNTLASSLHGSLTSPAYQWFSLKFRDDSLNNNKEAKAWLEDTEKRIFKALQESNFNLEANELYLDLVHFGTSIIVEELEGDELAGNVDLVFKTVPTKQCFFDMDAKGGVLSLYRKMCYTAAQIVDKFGAENVPQEIVDKAAMPTEGEKMDVIFCIYKRKLGTEYDVNRDGVLSAEKRPFGYKYILRNMCEQLGEEGGYYEMPAFVPRWRSTSESKFGNSPSMVALPDVLTLNELQEMLLRAIEKVVDPATMATERGLLSDLDLEPGGLTIVRDLDALKPFESRARFDVSELKVDRLQDAIRKAFFTDQLELKNSPAMTATEVSVRYELMQRLLGPTLGRLENDFLNPLITRTFNILLRAGQLAEIPDSLANSGADMDIRYTGPLARSQRADQAQSTERWMGMLGQMAQITPDILDVIDTDTIARDFADVLNVPAKYTVSEEKVAAIRKARQQQMAQAQAAEIAKMQGDAAKAVGEGDAAMRGQSK